MNYTLNTFMPTECKFRGKGQCEKCSMKNGCSLYVKGERNENH